jgi:hypothetical protein
VTRKRGGGNDRGGTDHTDGSPKRSRTSLGDVVAPSADGEEAEDGVSSLQEGSSVQRNIMEEKWRVLEERLHEMEERETRDKRVGEASVVSGGGSAISTPENELMLRENLRKFVVAKVFPSWNFIFKKNLLEKCVLAAVGKSHITVPPGCDENQLAQRCSQMVRACLDGCRANAQTAAKKGHLSE